MFDVELDKFEVFWYKFFVLICDRKIEELCKILMWLKVVVKDNKKV